MKFAFAALTVFLLNSLDLDAQRDKPVNSGDLIEKGTALYDSGDYKHALALYSQIGRNDTNFTRSLFLQAACYEADSDFDRSIIYCQKALALKNQREIEPALYNTYGNSLMQLKKYDEAIKIFDIGFSKYPAYPYFPFNKGICYQSMDSAEQAEGCFEQTLLLNPYMYSAHYQLGLTALKEGKLVQAYLSFFGYLLVNPDGRYQETALGLLQQISKSVDEVLELKNKRKFPLEENYQTVEDILLSKIALDPSYKLQSSLDDPIVRQIQVIFEKLQYADKNGDFWIQYYLPYFKRVYSSGKFEQFIYHCMMGVDAGKIQSYVKKNKKELQAFIDDAGEYFDNIRATRELYFPKRDLIEERYYYENGALAGKGRLVNKNKRLAGQWYFYYAEGNLSSVGQFSEAGERTGDWTFYYYSGTLRQKEHYDRGKLEGEQPTYYENGVLASTESYVDGKLDGLSKIYYYPGQIKTSSTFKLGKLDGELKQYSSNGTLISLSNYSNGVQTGSSKEFYNSGELKSESQFQTGKEEGPYKAYFENRKLQIEGQMKNGKSNGEWKYYYMSGQLKAIRNFVNDNEEGNSAEYYPNGRLEDSVFYKDKSNAEGDYYDKDGVLYSKLLYHGGKIVSGRYFDKAGRQIGISEVRDNVIDLITYTPRGFKKEHEYFDRSGNEIGADTLFYPSGKINQISEYKNGQTNGPSLTFYRNGKIEYQVSYTNGKQDGHYKSYYLNGQLESEGWMVDGDMQGDWVFYNNNGSLSSKATYLDGQLFGYRDQYNLGGKIEYEEKYLSGWLQELTQYDSLGNVVAHDSFPQCCGKYELLYPNKKVMVSANLIQGNFDGPYASYFFDGSVESIQFYKNGIKDSLYTKYEYGGVKNSEGRFRYGKKWGIWSSYNDEGRLEYTTEYADDQMNGLKQNYNAGGKVEFELPYRDDQRNGASKKFDSQGNLAYQVSYDGGDAMDYTYPGSDGKPVPFIPIAPVNGILKSYYSNGKPSRECIYNDGETNGPDVLYYMNGQIRSSDTSDYGEYEGHALEYYENGKISSDYQYANGSADGVCRDFYSNGMLRKEMSCVEGVNHGPTKYYDEKGKLIRTLIYYYGTLLTVKK